MKQQNVRKRITDQYRDAGFDKQQAVKMADPLVELHENMVTKDDLAEAIAPLATRAEMKVGFAELRAEMADLRGELRAEMADLRTEMADLRTDLRTEMADLRTDLRTKVSDLRGDLQSEISKMESRLIRWFFAAVVGGIAAATGLLRLLEYLF